MIRLIAYLLILWPSLALAQTSIPLGDLNVPTTHVGQWYPASVAEAGYEAAKSWPQYDATCICESAGCSAPINSAGGACTPSAGTSAYPQPTDTCRTSQGAANPADETGAATKDFSAITCMLQNIPDNSVIYLPIGIYNMGDSNAGVGEVIRITRNNVVLRGEDNTSTGSVIETTTITCTGTGPGTGDPSCRAVGGVACGGDSILGRPAGEMCTAQSVSIGSGIGNVSYTAWTAGWAYEDKTITVADASGFSVGEWVFLFIWNAGNVCPLEYLPQVPNQLENAHRALTQIMKIESKGSPGANDVTFDRGLRMDYDLEAGCNADARMYHFNTRSNVGVENLHMTSDTGILQTELRDQPFIAFGAGTVESWAVGNELYRGEAVVVAFTASARNWLQGNWIHYFGLIDDTFNTSAIHNGTAAGDNVMENNAVTDFRVGFYNNQGAWGNIIGFNFLDSGSPPPGGTERCILGGHGLYTRVNLFENNDMNCALEFVDRWWGNSGRAQTAYKNRILRKNGYGNGTISYEYQNKCDSPTCPSYHDAAEKPVVIGNLAGFFSAAPTTGSGMQNNTDLHDLDGTSSNGNDGGKFQDGWWEKNRWVSAVTCVSDPGECDTGTEIGSWCKVDGDCAGPGTCDLNARPDRCGFHMDSPNAWTSCGTTPGDCLTGSGPNGILGNNYATEAPSSDHDNDTTYPTAGYIPPSFYRTAAPSWWCAESATCDFYDAHQGLGAWGDTVCIDDFDAVDASPPLQELGYPDGNCDSDGTTKLDLGLCQLPAERLYLGLPCTQLGAGPPKSVFGRGLSGRSRGQQ